MKYISDMFFIYDCIYVCHVRPHCERFYLSSCKWDCLISAHFTNICFSVSSPSLSTFLLPQPTISQPGTQAWYWKSAWQGQWLWTLTILSCCRQEGIQLSRVVNQCMWVYRAAVPGSHWLSKNICIHDASCQSNLDFQPSIGLQNNNGNRHSPLITAYIPPSSDISSIMAWWEELEKGMEELIMFLNDCSTCLQNVLHYIWKRIT